MSVAIESLHFFPEGDDRGKHQALLMRNTQLLYMGLPVGQDELFRIVLVVFFSFFFFTPVFLLLFLFCCFVDIDLLSPDNGQGLHTGC